MPINNMDAVMLDDLIGYEIQKKKLVDNTLAFVEGKKGKQLCCCSVTVVPVNPQVSRQSSMSFMTRACV